MIAKHFVHVFLKSLKLYWYLLFFLLPTNCPRFNNPRDTTHSFWSIYSPVNVNIYTGVECRFNRELLFDKYFTKSCHIQFIIYHIMSFVIKGLLSIVLLTEIMFVKFHPLISLILSYDLSGLAMLFLTLEHWLSIKVLCFWNRIISFWDKKDFFLEFHIAKTNWNLNLVS